MKVTNSIHHFKANKMSKEQAQYVDNELSKAKKVDIICHDMTDRDGANSALAMWEYMSAKGIEARVILSKNIPEALNLRHYNCNIVQAFDVDKLNSIQPDIAFCVDFGGENRVLPQVLKHINNAPKVMGFDHHSEVEVAKNGYLQLKQPVNDEAIISNAPFYSDMSAKSATSIIYRFFEALGEELTNERAYDLFFGLVDDAAKRNLIKCDGQKGEIIEQKSLTEDKNAYEIYFKLKEKLSEEQIGTIVKSVDLISSLNEEQQAFRDSLKNKMKYSENKKIAYVEIPPDDNEWRSLGGDNTVTSTILNRFRQEVLSSNKDIEAAICFYEAHGNYRFSVHSRDKNLINFFKYVEENAIENFSKNAGGHRNRAGGGMNSVEPEKCAKWVSDIISCDKFFEN